MPPLGFDFAKAHIQTAFFYCLDHGFRLVSGVEPVRSERDDQKCRPHLLECSDGRPFPVLFFKIEIVRRFGDVKKGVGIKSFDKLAPLVSKIAFYLEISVEIKGKISPILKPSSKFKAH